MHLQLTGKKKENVGFQKVRNLFLSFESSNARKISLEGGESRSWGPRGGKS